MVKISKAKRIIFVIFLMTLTLGFGIDLYAPSFPAIASSLKTSQQWVQLTIATYFGGYVLGMLFLGPISDSWGRKKPLIIGTFLYCVMSLFCALSTTIYLLLVLRFLQGLCVSAIGVMNRSILGDYFTGKRLAKAMNYFVMSYRIGPIIAPLIGGYLEVYLGWPSNFYFLAIYGLFIVSMIIWLLPETHFEVSTFHPKLIVHRYISILKHRAFVGGAICIGMTYSMIIIFNVVGPFFIQEILDYSPISYGHIAFYLGVIAFIGILVNRFLIHFRSHTEMISIGIYLSLPLAILQVILAFMFPANLYSFIIPVMGLLFVSGFVVSNMTTQIIDLIPRGKGAASALLGIIIISLTGILTALSSFLRSTTARPIAFAFLAIVFASFLSYQLLFNKIKNK